MKKYLITILLLSTFILNNGPAIAENIVKAIKLPESLSDIVVNPETGKAYVASLTTNSIIVIDNFKKADEISLGAIQGSVKVGVEGKSIPLVIELDVNSATNIIYATSFDNKTVTVVNGNTNKTTDSISLNSSPQDISANPSTNKIYVTLTGKEDNLVVIDGSNNSIESMITIDDSINKIDVNSKTNKIYIGSNDNIVYVVDGATNAIESILLPRDNDFPDDVEGIAVNEKLNKIYVTFEGKLHVINGSNNQVIKQIKLDSPSGIAIDEGKNRVHVGDNFIEVITTFDSTSDQIIETTHVLREVRDLSVDPNKGLLYVSGGLNDKGYLSVFAEGDLNTSGFSEEDGLALFALSNDIGDSRNGFISSLSGRGSIPTNVRHLAGPILKASAKVIKALEANKSKCNKKLPRAFKKLQKLINQMKKINKSFYEGEGLDSDFEDTKIAVNTDTDANGIPDVCGN